MDIKRQITFTEKEVHLLEDIYTLLYWPPAHMYGEQFREQVKEFKGHVKSRESVDMLQDIIDKAKKLWAK